MDIFGNFSILKGDKGKRYVQRKGELDYSYSQTALNTVGEVEDKTSSSRSSGSMKAILLLFFCILGARLFSSSS